MLKGFDKTDENIEKLKKAIKEIYPTLNKKKKGKFSSSKELKKWLDEESLNQLVN